MKKKLPINIIEMFQIFQIFSVQADETDGNRLVELMDLPPELRMEIFDHFNFTNLLSVSQAIPQDQPIIAPLFCEMIKDQTFGVNFDQGNVIASVYYKRKKIMRTDFNEFGGLLEFLRNFGHCIKKLEIVYYWYRNETNLNQFHEHIRHYVANSVNDIRIHMDDKPVNRYLNDLIIPFPNAKEVKLSHSSIDQATLHQMFPAVESLDFKSITMSENLNHFPNLTRLTVPENWGLSEATLPIFQQTIELNPQLQHLSIDRCYHWPFVQFLDGTTLESLDISNSMYTDRHNRQVHFPNMKVFKFKLLRGWEDYLERIPVRFGSLEEIEYNRKGLTSYWINVMRENRNVKKISVLGALDHRSLPRVALEMPSLQEFSMKYEDDDYKHIPNIVNFLASANQLRKASFLQFGEYNCAEVARQVNDEWEATVFDLYSCYFIRRNL